MSSKIEDSLKLLKDKDISFVDLRFTDLKGQWQHITQHVDTISEDSFVDGFMFDGSSLAGWKDISESDMTILPDAQTIATDPFAAQPTVSVICDIVDPGTGRPYTRDPRSVAHAAETFMKSSGVGDQAYFGPEAEFFVFDDVRFTSGMYESAYRVDGEELPSNSNRVDEAGNMGHRPANKGGYVPTPPIDGGQDLRAEMVSTMHEMGLTAEKHHHEVAPCQHELGVTFNTLVRAADEMQIYKYCVRMVASSYGKTATFMPKPIRDDNGSGMHTHQSIWKAGKPVFAGSGYADLSETALYYIGGILKHAKTLNAFTNPATNSYKRLVPGFEAPVLLAYSARNRSAACRIPFATSEKGKRIEIRFPDPMANPYFAFSAMLMAGLDGIRNRIHPGDPMDKNLYDLPPEELQGIPVVCGSLAEALDSLENDHEFLLQGDVFTPDLIEGYIDLKRQDVETLNLSPHPAEFEMYYSL
ncbi:MAG: type I glutamate--ammonia ligase [Pseudomonadota bacterium]